MTREPGAKPSQPRDRMNPRKRCVIKTPPAASTILLSKYPMTWPSMIHEEIVQSSANASQKADWQTQYASWGFDLGFRIEPTVKPYIVSQFFFSNPRINL